MIININIIFARKKIRKIEGKLRHIKSDEECIAFILLN